MSEAVNFYKEPGEPLDRSAIDLGPYVPAPDDDMLVCRCEEVTKGEIRRAIHDGMYTMAEVRRFLRQGMGLCQGQTCTKLVPASWRPSSRERRPRRSSSPRPRARP